MFFVLPLLSKRPVLRAAAQRHSTQGGLSSNKSFVSTKRILQSFDPHNSFERLWAWKDRHEWGDSRDVGRRFLLELFSYRDQIRATRNPAFYPSEYQASLNELDPQEAELPYWKKFYSYDYRIRRLDEKTSELRAVMNEAIVIWGDEVFFGVTFSGVERKRGQREPSLLVQTMRAQIPVLV